MISDNSHMKYSDLIIDYLDGNISDSDKIDVEAWVAKSEENKTFFEEVKKTWNNDVPGLDANQALNKFYKRIEKTENKSKPEPKVISINKKRKVFSLRIASQIAAALVIGVGLGYFLNDNPADPGTVTAEIKTEKPDSLSAVRLIEIVSAEESVTKTLADGSIIHLKKNSSVSYPESFEDEIRSITLNKGSVFCEVEHKPNDAVFLVHGGKTTVQVVGTKFLVEKISEDDLSVFVEEGLVIVYKNNDQIKQVLVSKGQKAISKTKNERVQVIGNADPNIMSWHSRDLNFKRMRMSEVIALMNNVYHTDIKVKDEEILDYELTAKFDGASPEEIMFYIGEIFNIEVKKEGDSFLIFARP